ncbi:MAG: DNA-binding protein [Microgenomates group bacterium]|jgi:predicted DNA-binding protein with PD1-like motif|nr:DNA-binding protein [Microgenomates group bacterium]
MFYKKLSNKEYVIRIRRGNKIIKELKSFCLKEKVTGGFFYGLGAVDQAELAHYDVSTKKYSSKKFSLPLEMTNITGSVGVGDKELIVHAHATFADKKMRAVAGHLIEARVSGTAEIFFTKTARLTKIYDQKTGLKLFSL